MTAPVVNLATFRARRSPAHLQRAFDLAATDYELARCEDELSLARQRRDALPRGERPWLRAHVDVVRLVERWGELAARRQRVMGEWLRG